MTKDNKRTVIVYAGTFIFSVLSWFIAFIIGFNISYVQWTIIYFLVTLSLATHIEIEKIILKKFNP